MQHELEELLWQQEEDERKEREDEEAEIRRLFELQRQQQEALRRLRSLQAGGNSTTGSKRMNNNSPNQLTPSPTTLSSMSSGEGNESPWDRAPPRLDVRTASAKYRNTKLANSRAKKSLRLARRTRKGRRVKEKDQPSPGQGMFVNRVTNRFVKQVNCHL